MRLFPTDWLALEPTASLGTGLLSFTMAKAKWGQTCENSASAAGCLWCNTGTAGTGAQDHESAAHAVIGTGSAASILEGTLFGTNAAVGDVLVFKTKPVTSAGTTRFSVVATTARDFVVHSQSLT